jgi:hypothetical protein
VKRQRGAALLAVFAVLLAVTAVTAAATLRQAATPYARDATERRALVLARDALWGHAQAQHCLAPLRPIDTLLACPDSVAAEGVAAPACAGTSRGWLPWRTLELPPLRDRSGACLWIERNGATVRIIAPGAAGPGQSRVADPSRLVCSGNFNAANYLDATDPALTLTLEAGALAAVCP